ncbi:ABC transporter permease [Streptomyces griseorubiginosus]|uniref:ABC transporter permease n=1 Tax=Streptomyces griseorubiginosus TaxID=67304 RepID=UPI001AD66FAE|nr:ABC transporter permease [Streptomyces griseorubiginosus]MBO4252461.1 FtsX-like permease family protein [Streptomyces griseorubiginosus]
MSAVWRASRAAVRRRRLQTAVIGVVVLVSSTALVVALGLLDIASGPFDRLFGQAHGAHVIATFDAAKVSGAQLAQTAHRPGVRASAGPFPQAVIEVPQSAASQSLGMEPGPLQVVGRADPGGPLDRLDLFTGHWATGRGQIVLALPDVPGLGKGPNSPIGKRIQLPGLPPLTVVGLASSVSETAQAWVSPHQIAALHPTTYQMLYRFDQATTARQITVYTAAATADLPSGSLLAHQSYLALKAQIASKPNAFVPFLMAFGILGLLVAVLIVGNVVSGAVVSGFRHIGVLKSLGFTPNQVVAVYLMMVCVPATAGAVAGTALGALVAQPLLHQVFTGADLGTVIVTPTIASWVYATTALGMPAVVLLAALIPALRAHRLSAARAISAGSAPGGGRGRAVQRWLTGVGMPRPVTLGLGLPLARPGRAMLTVCAVLLGVATATLATGLSATMVSYGNAVEGAGRAQVIVDRGEARVGQTVPKHGDTAAQALLRGLPQAAHVSAVGYVNVRLLGQNQEVTIEGQRGDRSALQDDLARGRWMRGPGEVVASGRFLSKEGLRLGDSFALAAADGRQQRVRLVGEVMSGPADSLRADWTTVTALAPGAQASQYWVRLIKGADAGTYMKAVRAADPGLYPSAKTSVNAGAVTVIGSAALLTLMLTVVAAMGVFNTVVLNSRERRRDLGMLKSIGMTPRQVTVMMVVSMAGLGLLGGILGLPLGVVAYRVVIPVTEHSANLTFPDRMLEVWHPGSMTLLALAGVAIAALGAVLPARTAARQTIAQVLHTE